MFYTLKKKKKTNIILIILIKNYQQINLSLKLKPVIGRGGLAWPSTTLRLYTSGQIYEKFLKSGILS